MKSVFVTCLVLISMAGCKGQSSGQEQRSTPVGGPCEGCEAIYEYGDKKLSSSVTLPGYDKNEPKVHISGTIYHPDGTPAEDVILYIYHTNREGLYKAANNEQGWGRHHGSIRGWIKTGSDGEYKIYTFRPAAYPQRSEPEHIHITVKEPGINEYYIDSIVFDDDPLLTEDHRSRLSNRGGSGVVTPSNENGVQVAKRDIFLGENIPEY